jgi:hypothetical protein
MPTRPYLRHENSYTDSLQVAARILLLLLIVISAEQLAFSGHSATWLYSALAQPGWVIAPAAIRP